MYENVYITYNFPNVLCKGLKTMHLVDKFRGLCWNMECHVLFHVAWYEHTQSIDVMACLRTQGA